MINQITLAGRLTQDPELKETSKGSYCILRLAVQRPFKNKDGVYDTDFFDVKTWQGNAETVYKNCKKGSIAVVFGRVSPYNYTTKDEQKVHTVEIIGDRVIYTGKVTTVKDLGDEEENLIELED